VFYIDPHKTLAMTEQPKRKRGRPRGYDPDTAITQARDAFWDAGYAGTSLDDIGAATGMNRPSLYAAFGDKQALYMQALRHYAAMYTAAFDAALAYDKPLRAALTRAYDAAATIYLSGGKGARGCFLISTAMTEAIANQAVRAAMTEGLRSLDQRFEARLRAAQRQGELDRAADPAALAKLASAVIYYIAVQARLGATRAALRSTAEAAVELICGPAIAASPSPRRRAPSPR
jgi:TetR/AcrR family transcriptional regulator, copper-responsive repressor